MIDSANRRGRGRNVTLPAAVLLLAALVGGCSDDGETEPRGSDAPTPPADPTPTETNPVDDVRAAWEAYWAAVIASENEGDPSPERFAGVATGGHVEQQLNKVRGYQEIGFVRVGEPEITEVEVTVDGETATVEGCVNQDVWGAKLNGKKIAPPDLGPLPAGAGLELVDGNWLIVDRYKAKSKRC